MTTYLTPVATTLDEARMIADRRGTIRDASRSGQEGWDIRKNFDGFYVVPAHDRGYDVVGSFIERRHNGVRVELL